MQEKQNAMDVPNLSALNSLGLTDFEDYVMGEESREAPSSATAVPLSAVLLPEQPPAARSGNSPPTALSSPMHAPLRSFSLSPAGSAHTTPRAAARQLCFDQAPAAHEATRPGAGEGTAVASAAQGMPAIPPASTPAVPPAQASVSQSQAMFWSTSPGSIALRGDSADDGI